MTPLPIHFAIDLEPDGRLPEEDRPPFDSAGVALERMAALRDGIAEATGAPAHFGWYVRMDRHVEALYGDAGAIAKRYAPLLEAASNCGDEIGLHVHANDRGPDGAWRANFADRAAVLEGVEESFRAFESIFGRRCRSLRMGDMWTSEECMRKIADCGAQFDLTVESGLRPQGIKALYPGTDSKGWRSSQLGAPLAPWRPFEDAYPDFWALPLSSYRRSDFHHVGMWLVSAFSAVTTGFRRNRARKMLRPQEAYGPGELETALASALAEGAQPGFAFAIRNYGAAPDVEHFLNALTDLAHERPIRFCTPPDYIALASADY